MLFTFAVGAVFMIAWYYLDAPENTLTLDCNPQGSLILHTPLDGRAGLIAERRNGAEVLIHDGDIQGIAIHRTSPYALVSIRLGSKQYRLARIALDDGRIEMLTSPEEADDFFPAWLTDQKAVFWRSMQRSGDLFGGTNPAGFEVMTIDVESKTVEQLTRDEFFDVSKLVVLDANEVYFQATDKVYQMDVSSKTAVPVSELEGYTPVSRGRAPNTVITIGDKNGDYRYDLFEFDLRDRSKKQLTWEGRFIEDACLSANAREVHYITSNGSAELRVIKGNEPPSD